MAVDLIDVSSIETDVDVTMFLAVELLVLVIVLLVIGFIVVVEKATVRAFVIFSVSVGFCVCIDAVDVCPVELVEVVEVCEEVKVAEVVKVEMNELVEVLEIVVNRGESSGGGEVNRGCCSVGVVCLFMIDDEVVETIRGGAVVVKTVVSLMLLDLVLVDITVSGVESNWIAVEDVIFFGVVTSWIIVVVSVVVVVALILPLALIDVLFSVLVAKLAVEAREDAFVDVM